MFCLSHQRHAKVTTVCSDKLCAQRNLVFLLLGAYIVSTYSVYNEINLVTDDISFLMT